MQMMDPWTLQEREDFLQGRRGLGWGRWGDGCYFLKVASKSRKKRCGRAYSRVTAYLTYS